jgi:hypothetical protein
MVSTGTTVAPGVSKPERRMDMAEVYSDRGTEGTHSKNMNWLLLLVLAAIIIAIIVAIAS